MEGWEDEGGGDAPYTHAYAFLPRATLQGVYADRFMDVSVMVGHSYSSWKDLIATYQAMGMDKDNIAAMQSIVGSVEALFMRARFNSDGASVHLVRTSSPITGEDMDAILTAKQQSGELASFLRASRIG